MSKNRPDAETFDIPIQRTIFGRGRAACANVVFWTTDVAGQKKAMLQSAPYVHSLGNGQKIWLFWTTTCIFWTAIYVADKVFLDHQRSVK
jgi:hypothetical protein